MGTFGAGPFDSDGAQDLLDSLAARPADQRGAVLAALLAQPVADPGCVGSEVFADEVVAAVAVIAAGLPQVAAGEPWWRDVIEAAGPAAPATDRPRLVELASAALPIVVEPWERGWVSEDDAMAARETVRRLSEALRTR
ncbi:DUF4259 domain-containing protein [Lentzea flava]|uniref:DUF4259 domain-containing protein n=1 Tax=Lentzea flava TaxID=103732 RepID=A0ABQ2UW25_9PSEU|nr:DUF4259 domain-containing protein [Lentzea flava]MCP2201466.1 protein of unknown function (DUF4259) [Lentzea flava]GGU52673.1 hypothetical protein GCM10010178_51830 [Lentzea flava]